MLFIARKILILFTLLLISLNSIAAEKILVLGDSLSAGFGIEVKQGWVNLLQQRLHKLGYDYHVVNASISGNTTSNGLARISHALATYKPAITIIELGGNDGLRGFDPKIIKKNLAIMIEKVQQSNSKILLLGLRLPLNYGPAYDEKFKALYQNLSQHYQIPLVPLFLAGIDDKPALMQNDGIHPLAAAQDKMLDNVWIKLQPLLKK